MSQSAELLNLVEHTLHHIALAFMALVYTIRILWFLGFKAGKERQAATGAPDTTPVKGGIYSMFNIAMPWVMESTRTKPLFYLQFVIFHIGVTVSIGMLFIIPFVPELLANNAWLVTTIQVITGAACAVGVLRLIRRASDPYVRAISTPDDFFSLLLLTVWFFFAMLAAPNDRSAGLWHMHGYYWLATFFLIYVPFSKISHYLYYPFTRWYLGKTLGRRGSFPVRRVPPTA